MTEQVACPQCGVKHQCKGEPALIPLPMHETWKHLLSECGRIGLAHYRMDHDGRLVRPGLSNQERTWGRDLTVSAFMHYLDAMWRTLDLDGYGYCPYADCYKRLVYFEGSTSTGKAITQTLREARTNDAYCLQITHQANDTELARPVTWRVHHVPTWGRPLVSVAS